MRSWLLAALTLLLPLAAVCQSESITSFYNKYENLEEVTDLTLSGGLLKMISEYKGGDDQDPLQKVSHLRLLVMEERNAVQKNDLKALFSGIQKENFEQLVQVRDEQTLVDIYIQEKDKLISNALLVVNEPDNFVMISLEGAFSLSELENLNIDVEGAEYFKKYNKNKEKNKSKKKL
ncbi:MAG: DUF4252 domain-containing protein [Bacteroidota bacterium]